jgi:hypothetical protein
MGYKIESVNFVVQPKTSFREFSPVVEFPLIPRREFTRGMFPMSLPSAIFTSITGPNTRDAPLATRESPITQEDDTYGT